MTMCTIQCLIKSLQSKSLQLSQNWPYTTYVFVFIYFCVFWRHCWFFPQLLLPCVVAMGFEKDWLYAPMQPPTQWHRLIQVTQFSSVQLLSHVWLFATPCMDCSMPGFPVHHQLLEFTQTHVLWVSHPTISSSVLPFSSCPQSLPASGSFQMSQFFASGGQSIGISASSSVLPMNIQDWFPLE